MSFGVLCLRLHSFRVCSLIQLAIFSLTLWLFSSVFISIYLWISQGFFFLLLISNFNPLWSKNILCMITVLLNILTLVLWCRSWSIIENVPCVLEIEVYSNMAGWSALEVSVRSTLGIVLPGVLLLPPFLFIIEVRYWNLWLLLVNSLFLHSIQSAFASHILLGASVFMIIITSCWTELLSW